VSDAEVKVSEEEVKAYMQKHAAMYTNEQPTRTIEYVSFDILPSSADTARAIEGLEAIRTDLANAKDYKSFVNNKSEEVNSYTEAFYNKRTFMSRYADTIMTLPVGGLYGPYFENGGYRLTKVTDRKTLPDSVKMRHVLVMTKSQGKEIMSDTLAKMKLDSAMTAIKAGGKFDSVVNAFSMDEQSKKNGGEYTFTLQQRVTVSKELGDYIFDGKAGDKGVVKVSNDNYSGYHYVEVIEQKGIAPSIQMATIAKLLAPSDSTVNAIYGLANEFAGKNQAAADFDATIKKQNLDRRIGDNVKVNSFSIPGLGASREIIKWMYDHKVGDVSAVFQLGDQRYVVAKLAGIQEGGLQPLTAANRPAIEQKVRDEKKAELLAKKFAGQSSLDAVAQAANVTVQVADTVAMGGGFVASLGYEPKVVGYVFNKAFQPNTLSPAIKGQGGVYFVTVNSRVMNPIGQELMPMLAQQRGMQENQMKNQISQTLQQTLTKKAKVEYNHANF
jgi:peptidyl-prolyl cis-trans isomerase D